MSPMLRPLVVLTAVLPFSTGCLLAIGDGGGWIGPRTYTSQADDRDLDLSGVSTLEVRTHNGRIDVDGQDAGPAHLTVTKKAGGASMSDAEEALAAIDVFVESAPGGVVRVGWKWRVPRRPGWSGDVSFAIRAPRSIRLDVETHNGDTTVGGMAADVRAVTHNGELKVDSSAGTLHAESHNGAIRAAYAGPAVTIVSHNGEVVVDLSRCAAVTGNVTSNNGAVQVFVGESTSASVECRTHNGEVRADAPLDQVRKSRGRLTGKLGAGDGQLELRTHNGDVRLQKASGA